MKHFRRHDKGQAAAKGDGGPQRAAGNSRNGGKRAHVALEDGGGHRCKTCNMVPVPAPHTKCVQCRALDGI